MLGSFASSSHEEEDDPSPPPDHHHVHHRRHYHHDHQIQLGRSFTNNSPAIHMRQLLIRCAELISTRSDPSSAHRLITILMANSNPCGDSTERLIHHFTRALSLLLNTSYATTAAAAAAAATGLSTFFITNTTTTPHREAFSPSSSSAGSINIDISNNTTQLLVGYSDQDQDRDHEAQAALVQSSYLSLNQVTPFIRFSQLTANQAILDAIEVGQGAIHILDFDIMHGLQWPPFMQAIKERYPHQPSLRITGAGNDLDTLRRTGDRLAKFAHSLGLTFQFHPLLMLDDDQNDQNNPASAAAAAAFASAVVLLPEETLAVNCVHYLHRLLKNRDGVRCFLHAIKGMNPRVVTMAEREANHNHPLFLQRFVEALDHYAAVFDSLEATLPPTSRERLDVERVWFGREIVDIVAAQGDRRKQRHERFRSWESMFRSSGFSNVPLSPYALSQAKLLLRLHYPSEGYQLFILDHSLFLGWQNQPLFSVSSWR